MADSKYREIAEDLRTKIESGEMRPGAQLPTELELRELYGNTSRNTVRDAIRLLSNRRLVEARPGKGTFVVDQIDPVLVDLTPPGAGGSTETFRYRSEASGQRRTAGSDDPQVEVKRAADTPRVTESLNLGPDGPVVVRSQARYIDRRPFSLQTSFYPMDFVNRGATQLLHATNIEPSAVAYLRDTLGAEEVGAQDTLTVRTPDEAETRFFRLPEAGGVAIVEQFRITYDRQGVPLRVTVTVYPADRNVFTLTGGDVPG